MLSTLLPFMCGHIQKVRHTWLSPKCHKPKTTSHARGAESQHPEPLASGMCPATPFLPGGHAQLGGWEGGWPAYCPGGRRDPPAHRGSGFVWLCEKRWVGHTSNTGDHVTARPWPHCGPTYETETAAIHRRGGALRFAERVPKMCGLVWLPEA